MSSIFEYEVKMTCTGCSGAVEKVLGKYQGRGIDKVEINLDAQKVLVTTSMDHNEVLELIKKTGKSAQFIKKL